MQVEQPPATMSTIKEMRTQCREVNPPSKRWSGCRDMSAANQPYNHLQKYVQRLRWWCECISNNYTGKVYISRLVSTRRIYWAQLVI